MFFDICELGRVNEIAGFGELGRDRASSIPTVAIPRPYSPNIDGDTFEDVREDLPNLLECDDVDDLPIARSRSHKSKRVKSARVSFHSPVGQEGSDASRVGPGVVVGQNGGLAGTTSASQKNAVDPSSVELEEVPAETGSPQEATGSAARRVSVSPSPMLGLRKTTTMPRRASQKEDKTFGM